MERPKIYLEPVKENGQVKYLISREDNKLMSDYIKYLEEMIKSNKVNVNNLSNLEKSNDAKCLLAAGLRVKLHLLDVNSDLFVIPNFHFVPRDGDLIDVVQMIDENNYSDEEFKKIYKLSWSVWYVNWSKDEFGFFAEIVCKGE